MSAAVIVLLIGLWVAVLMPGLLRAHRDVSPATSISRFNRSMDLLERTGRGPVSETADDAPPVLPPRRAPVPRGGDGGPRRARATGGGPRARPPRAQTGLRVGADRVAKWLRAAGEAVAARGRAGGLVAWFRDGRGSATAPARARAHTRAPGAPRVRAPARPRNGPRGRSRARRRRSVAARRRAVLATLAYVTALGAVLALIVPVPGLALAGVGVVAFLSYVALLWRIQRQKVLRRRVRRLGVSSPASDGPESAPGRLDAVGERSG